jgi:phosphate transport system substrate-binding protein
METGEPVTGARVAPLDANNNGQADSQELYDSKDQAVQAVATGAYPSPPARDLNLVTLGQPSRLVNTFIKWILTDGQKYVDEVGYIPLTQEQLSKELEKLD